MAAQTGGIVLSLWPWQKLHYRELLITLETQLGGRGIYKGEGCWKRGKEERVRSSHGSHGSGREARVLT
jgi:hypothetical protein